MKYYEFSYRNFGYYSIIEANSEEEAINIFEEQVCDNEYGNCPEEIDKECAIDIVKSNENHEYKLRSIGQCLLVLA